MINEELFWELLKVIVVIAGMIFGFRAGWDMLKSKKKKGEEECRD